MKKLYFLPIVFMGVSTLTYAATASLCESLVVPSTWSGTVNSQRYGNPAPVTVQITVPATNQPLPLVPSNTPPRIYDVTLSLSTAPNQPNPGGETLGGLTAQCSASTLQITNIRTGSQLEMSLNSSSSAVLSGSLCQHDSTCTDTLSNGSLTR